MVLADQQEGGTNESAYSCRGSSGALDQRGNLYVSGPGGVWIVSPKGKHLGTIKGPELPANFAWGDEDGKTVYMTARTGLYRIRLKVAGIRR